MKRIGFFITFLTCMMTWNICHAGRWTDDFNHTMLHGWTLLSQGVEGEWIVDWGIEPDQLEVTMRFPPESHRGLSQASSLLELTAFPLSSEDFTMALEIVFDKTVSGFGGFGDVGLALGKHLPPEDRFYAEVVFLFARQVISRGINEEGLRRAGNLYGSYPPSQQLTVSFKAGGHFTVQTEHKTLTFLDPTFDQVDVVGILIFGRDGYEAIVDNFAIWGDGIPDGHATDLAVLPRGKLGHTWGHIKAECLP